MRASPMMAVWIGLLMSGCGPQANDPGAPHKERSADGKLEGDIVGVARPGSRFAQLRIGMSQREAEDLVGRPTDTDSHITGKQFIPFYFGGDAYRVVEFFKGQGQLEFAPRSFASQANALVRIVNNPAESGYAH